MRILLFALVSLRCLGLAVATAAQAPLEFNRDVRPILSDKCFGCHGPDKEHRKAGLRLDIREEAMKKLKSGDTPLQPGKPAESHILTRILSTDPDEMMPPPEAKMRKLTKAESEVIRRWIAEGAEYQPHWSFIPLKPFPVPSVSTGTLEARNDLDCLVFAHQAKLGLKPRPEAKPATLLRRVTLDLTGLPPTPAQVREFLADTQPGAYERLVERLLASESFGERMAADWLDIARYTDSFGFQVDKDREVWPWRDWVIGAFNRNLPFNDFVTWQLAGDLLPNPTREQILATAFNRLHQQESEGGSVEEEYRVEMVSDRVKTFGTAFLGLTFECCKCHDHKFDPLSQKEFFQMFAFFDDIEEAGLYSYFSAEDAPTPAMKLIPADAESKLRALEAGVTNAEGRLANIRTKQRADFAQWLLQKPSPAPAITGEVARFSFDLLEKDKLANAIDPSKPATLKGENRLVPGHSGNAIEFTGDDAVNLSVGAFNRVDPFSVALWLKTPDVKERAVILHRSKAALDSASRGFELLLEDGRLKWSMIRFWPGDAASVRAKETVKPGEWVHVVVCSDGSGRASGLKLFVNGVPAGTEVIKDNLSRDIGPVGHDFITLGERMRDRGFKGGLIDDVRVFDRELSGFEVARTFDETTAMALLGQTAESLSSEDWERLFETYLRTECPEYQTGLAALKTARAEWVGMLNAQKEIMVMKELSEPKKAYVLFRGQYDQRREEVFADTPAVLNPFPKDAPKNRLGLARWLTDPANPLLARVTVNRLWQSLFGRGITRTADDFGSQGALPEYQEALDWLSLQFITSGWDTKALLRSMVLSHTYRQESVAEMKMLKDDPENILLARGPRFRLPAEMIRDTFLQASGLLVPKIGGAPVVPYELKEAFRPMQSSAGEDVFRRSLYTKWRTTSPPPAMLSFDAPRRAVCTAKRELTNTPLQALILLNGPQYVEAARILGQNLHRKAGGNLDAMIEEGFLACLSRFPDAREREIVASLYTEQRDHFAAHPEEAQHLLKEGQTPSDPNIPASDAAAATVLAQALLNHDGAVVKQ